MSGRGPRRSGRNQAAPEEGVEDAASEDSFHSEVSEAATGRDQEERYSATIIWRYGGWVWGLGMGRYGAVLRVLRGPT